jgi:hypothetical protein
MLILRKNNVKKFRHFFIFQDRDLKLWESVRNGKDDFWSKFGRFLTSQKNFVRLHFFGHVVKLKKYCVFLSQCWTLIVLHTYLEKVKESSVWHKKNYSLNFENNSQGMYIGHMRACVTHFPPFLLHFTP